MMSAPAAAASAACTSDVSSVQTFWEFPTSMITQYEANTTYVSPATFKMRMGSEAESTWKTILKSCYKENNVRYISLHVQLVDLKTSDASKDYIDVSLIHIALLHPLNNKELLVKKDTSIRRMSLRNGCNIFGWDKFMKYEQLGSDPHPSMTFFIRVDAFCTEPQICTGKVPDVFASTSKKARKRKQDAIMDCRSDSKKIGSIQMKPSSDDNTGKNVMVKMALKMKWSRRKEDGLKDADCLLHTKTKSIAAHSLALSLYSPVIARMIKDAGFIPNAQDNPYHIHCHEWYEDSIKAMVEYCYLGEISWWEDDLEVLMNMGELGAYYQIPGLIKQCREMVLANTDAHNYMEMFVAMIGLNVELGPLLKDSESTLKEKLEEYKKSDFLQELLDLRCEYPKLVLTDYKRNMKEYSLVIFDMGSEEEETIDDDGFEEFYDIAMDLGEDEDFEEDDPMEDGGDD